jgi:hypothetical protein
MGKENEMEMNPGKSKAIKFTKARVKERIRYYSGNQSRKHAALTIEE